MVDIPKSVEIRSLEVANNEGHEAIVAGSDKPETTPFPTELFCCGFPQANHPGFHGAKIQAIAPCFVRNPGRTMSI